MSRTIVLILMLWNLANMAGLAWVVVQLSDEARNGAQARETQCDREPVQRKIADAAYAVRKALPAGSRITAAELDRWKRHAPECP